MILDLLLSSESFQFLDYFLKYLNLWIITHNEDQDGEEGEEGIEFYFQDLSLLYNCFSSLKSTIESSNRNKNFPYDPLPLYSKLSTVEQIILDKIQLLEENYQDDSHYENDDYQDSHESYQDNEDQ
eukprot:gene6231-7761_t